MDIYFIILLLAYIYGDGNISAENTTDGSTTDENITSTPTTYVPTRYRSCLVPKPLPTRDLLAECMSCRCDEKRRSCDINCHCDPDCSSEDKKTFTTNLNFVDLINRRKCFHSDPFYKINANTTLIRTEDGLYCAILKDENAAKCYLELEKLKHVDEFQSVFHKVITSELREVSFYGKKWRFGQPILALKPEHYYFLLGFPFNNLVTPCSSTGPFLYLTEATATCEYLVNSKNLCEENNFLNSLTYFNEIKIIQNGNSYHIIEDLRCDNTFLDCKNETIRSPVYNSETDTCENAITRVKYTFFHMGINGIVRSEVNLVPENVRGTLKQHFEVEFQWANISVSRDKQMEKKSGNPGYLIGHAVIAGDLVNDTIIDINPLTFPFSQTRNTCLFPQTVKFGKVLIFGCTISIPHTNLKEMCDSLKSQTQQFEELSTFNRVASFGDLKTSNLSNWIPIKSYLKENEFSDDVSFSMCRDVSLSFHLQLRWALTGHRALPQSKIVGASFTKVNSDYAFTCIGLKSCKTVNHKINLRFVVTFINVTRA